MSGLIAFGSIIFLWIFVRSVLKSNKTDIRKNVNSSKVENTFRRSGASHLDLASTNHVHEDLLHNNQNDILTNPAYSHIVGNIHNNDNMLNNNDIFTNPIYHDLPGNIYHND